MKFKGLLFTGIFLLVIGILTKALTEFDVLGLALIVFGVVLKAFYIIIKAIKGEYKPGKEMFFLVFGLIFFFIGMYYSELIDSIINPLYFIILGIILKIVFVLKFIQILRLKKSNKY